MKKLQLKGQRFGRLMVIEESGRAAEGTVLWICKCECGNFTIVRGRSLKKGNTKSCGCLRKDTVRKRSITHGLRKHPLYPVWNDMLHRCYNEKSKGYRNYGGRGIKVCDKWRNSVKNFIEDMYPSFKSGLSIDRVNNDGNYESDNCRWATQSQQNLNKRGYGTSKHCGVGYDKKYQKWQARLFMNGKSKHIGYFDTEQEAAQVVKAKRLEVYSI